MSSIKDFFENITKLLISERLNDYRESNNRIIGAVTQVESQINAIILAGSVAGLTAVAALSKNIFNSNIFISIVAFAVIASFIIAILLSVINLSLSTQTLLDIQRKIKKNYESLRSSNKDIENYRFKKAHEVLNIIILVCFCVGLISLLILLGAYTFGDKL